jgi:glycosyltransferase involved in cell wall biosynthesis
MRGFDPAVGNRWVPAPVALFSAVAHARTPLVLDEWDSVFFDRWAAAALGDCELLLGASTSSLATGEAAQRRGATYVLDRACPDIRVQQRLLVEEARKVGGTFRTNSQWFVERQVEEYERADFILSPSEYSRSSYPEHLRSKVVLAPLLGQSAGAPRAPKAAGAPFVLGIVGGSPLRKGMLYLLQAWEELALPNAQLKIRTGAEIYAYPLLRQLIGRQDNISFISYIKDINAFYGACDAFILPSVDDGFGMALFEAMANGVPAIASRNCGASELLVADKDCLLIDPFSVEQIKDAVSRLYESQELRERLSGSGAAAVAARQAGGAESPYEAGLGRLLQSLKKEVPLSSAG